MPDDRRTSRQRETLKATGPTGAHTAEVLSLLARTPGQGYSPTEITTRTSVPQSSLGRVLQRLQDHDLVVVDDNHYFVVEDRLTEIRRLTWDIDQLSAAHQIHDEHTAPEELDYTPTEELTQELPGEPADLTLDSK